MDVRRYAASCLEKTVGLSSSCSSEDENILFIDTLPMIDSELLAKTAASKDVTGLNFFYRCRTLAAQDLARDFMSSFKKLQFNYLTENVILGGVDPEREDFTLVTGSSGFYTKKLVQSCSDPFTALRVDYIELYSASVYTGLPIHIFVDGIETVLSQDIVIGYNKIVIGKYGREISISVSGLVGFQDTTFRGCSCDSTCCFDYFDYEGPTFNPSYEPWEPDVQYSTGDVLTYNGKNYIAIAEPKPDMGINPEGDTGQWEEYKMTSSSVSPMVVHVSCVCLPEELVCTYSHELAYAFRWKLAACIFEDLTTSRRDNPLVRNSKDDATDLVAKIMGGADSEGNEIKLSESKYWVELWSVQRGLKSSIKHSGCIKCRGTRTVSAVGKRG